MKIHMYPVPADTSEFWGGNWGVLVKSRMSQRANLTADWSVTFHAANRGLQTSFLTQLWDGNL